MNKKQLKMKKNLQDFLIKNSKVIDHMMNKQENGITFLRNQVLLSKNLSLAEKAQRKSLN